MAQLLRTLAEYSADYLIRQIDAGVDVVQIFDSWSGVLDETTFEQCCIRPVRVIVDRVRDKYPSVPIIGFPRGAGALYDHYRAATGVTALGLDWTVPAGQAQRLQGQGPIQGNLDPLRLVAGGKALADGVDTILEALGRGPLVFNLGHGITPETPIEHVEAMIARIRSATMSGPAEAGSRSIAWVRMVVALAVLAVLTVILFLVAGEGFYLWAKAIHVIAVISGWPECSICRGCSSIMPMRKKALFNRKRSR
jgi:hypothetical protein